MTSVNHHSHDRPRCVHCGNERGPWVPTGAHCEHGVQTFLCAPGHGCTVRAAELDRDATAEQEAQRRVNADIASAKVANRAELAQKAAASTDGSYSAMKSAIEKAGWLLPELDAETGLGIHHLSNFFDGIDELTVTEVHQLALVLGVDPRDWFGPAVDEQEVNR